jgi:adenosylmethionine-8-amino-7-oxononanoate aminotransferase
MLRHLGRPVFSVTGKADAEWELESGGGLRDLSGGPLLQSLVEVPVPPAQAFQMVGPAGGFDSPATRALETEVIARAGSFCGGALWASSGSDGVELALSVLETTSNGSDREFGYVVRVGSYHGNTFLTRRLSTRRREDYRGGTQGIRRIVVRASGSDWARAFIDELTAQEIPNPAVLLLESVPTTGVPFWPGREAYGELFAWCKERSIRVVVDEVAAGAYRHGWFSAFDWSSSTSQPDAVVLGKGLTCGRHPIACVLVSREIAELLRNEGGPTPGFTYGLGEAGAHWIRGCLAAYDRLAENNYREQRDATIGRCTQALERVPGIQVESSPTTVRLEIPDSAAAGALLQRLEERQLIAYATSATREGRLVTYVLVCPPLDMDPERVNDQLDDFLDAVGEAR